MLETKHAGFKRGRAIGVTTAAIVVIVAFIVAVTALGSFTRTPGGVVAVVRNGGPLDNNRIRQVIQPASSRVYSGLFSSVHEYPAQQRFYTITSDTARGDRTGVDVELDPTKDGVQVGIEGTVYFTLNTDPKVLSDFDNKYGTRTYRGLDNAVRHAYDGDDGWDSFLDQIVRPVISNDLREQIGDSRCEQLVSSCALVQNTSAATTTALGGNTNLAVIQDAINKSLQADLNSTLQGNYFEDIRFNLAKVNLPTKLQDAIDQAQAAFAQITEAQARVASAKADAAANEQRQQGYQQCPACAAIDELKAIPPNVTTFAPGAGFAITAPAAAPAAAPTSVAPASTAPAKK
jgi:regulator of protease activity HflC (stomatin/prohibitin superfamily)